MSLVDDVSGPEREQLAVLYCDISHADAFGSVESEIAPWRVNYFRVAGEVAADFGGHQTTTAAGGWIATFTSTVDALICARELSSLVGWAAGGPNLSGGLSAGTVTREPFGIAGSPVEEAIALCRRARPRQVLVADPLPVIVSAGTDSSFAPAPRDVAAAEYQPDRRPPLPLGGRKPPFADPGVNSERPSCQGFGGRNWRGAGRRDGTRAEKRADKPHTRSSLRLIKDQDPAPTTPGLDAAAFVRTGPTTASTILSPDGVPAGAPPADGVRLTILGWVQLEAGEPSVRRASLPGGQARTVLSMLALRRGPVHKEELAEMLWPSSRPGHWDGALRGLVTKVRRFLDEGGLPGRETLLGDGGFYELRLPRGVSVDRDLASALVASAEAAMAAGQPEQAVTLVRRAVPILERRLLSGRDDAWFDQVRAELARERVRALELWARAELAIGGIEAAKRAATETLAHDPYRESGYRLLMEAHAAAGSRGEALRTYEKCRRTLAEDLGVVPAPQTEALYLRLLG